MKTIKRHLVLCAAVLWCTGCVTNMGPGGATPGFFHSNVTYPNLINPNMQYRIVFERHDIELLGPVEVESASRWICFFVAYGDSGYAALMKKAREMGGDGLMNVTVDTNFESFFIFYAKVTTRLTGQVYRYVRTTDPHPGG